MRLTKPVIYTLYAWSLAGLVLFTGSLLGFGFRINPTLGPAEYPVKAITGALLFSGSTLMIISATGLKKQSTAWTIAIIGLFFNILAWTLYTISVAYIDIFALFPLIAGIGYTTSHVVKFIEVLKDEIKTRQNVEALKELGVIKDV